MDWMLILKIVAVYWGVGLLIAALLLFFRHRELWWNCRSDTQYFLTALLVLIFVLFIGSIIWPWCLYDSIKYLLDEKRRKTEGETAGNSG